MFLLACNDAVHGGPKLLCEFLRLDSSGESKIWSQCAVEFALHVLSLIGGSYTARDRFPFALLTRSTERGKK